MEGQLTMTPTFTQEIEKRINDSSKSGDVRVELSELIATAKLLHAEERNISLLSVRLVGLLDEQNGPTSTTSRKRSRFGF